MHYASASGRAGLCFEIQMGMIDRGAEISWLSQYPHEKEILFAPLAGFEVKHTRIEGNVLVVVVSLAVNLTAQTIEQARGLAAAASLSLSPLPASLCCRCCRCRRCCRCCRRWR